MSPVGEAGHKAVSAGAVEDGRPTERLTPFNESNRKADASAFAALIKHVREVDAAHTVIMVQVENEVGVIPEFGSGEFGPCRYGSKGVDGLHRETQR